MSSPVNDPHLRHPSPHKFLARDRSTSRPSSRSSLRSHSPSLPLDDPVHVRNHISTLKHNIRHQQAQLQSLENIIRAGPRPYPPDFSLSMTADDTSTLVASPSLPPSAFKDSTSKAKRRSSYDILQGIAGPDSSLPLPTKRVDDTNEVNGTDVIREGIPMNFGNSSASAQSRRPSSPTRSLSRIPVSAVGNARALADDGHCTPVRSSVLTKALPANDSNLPVITSTTPDTSFASLSPGSPSPNPNPSLSSLNPPPSPRRASLAPGGTTKVLADLQAGVINARNALENTKSQLRLSQRTVASLTRKVEDLKEVEDRLRVENEGLNNVVARKERLLQEVLERARKAEAEAATLKQQLKQETTTSKKTIREMETTLAESTALSKKSEREYITLRDSVKGLVESWKHDTESLRTEMKKREERWKKEVDGVGKKYKDLVQSVKEKERVWEEEWKRLREEDKKAQKEVEAIWLGEIGKLEVVVEKSGTDCDKASRTAKDLADELMILRRRIKSVKLTSAENQLQEVTIPLVTDAAHTTVSSRTDQENVPP